MEDFIDDSYSADDIYDEDESLDDETLIRKSSVMNEDTWAIQASNELDVEHGGPMYARIRLIVNTYIDMNFRDEIADNQDAREYSAIQLLMEGKAMYIGNSSV